MKAKLFATLVAISIAISACGYAFVGRGSSLPEGILSIAIPQFKNKTGEPNLDTIVTGIIKKAFIVDGRLVVKNPENADSILTGVIQTYTLSPLAYDSNNNVTEYSVALKLLLTHTSTATGKVLVKQKLVTDWRYKVDPAILLAESSRLDATKEAAERVADTIVSLIIEAF